MASQIRPQKSKAEREDAILRKIFRVSLVEVDRDPASVYLDVTAGELVLDNRPLMLNADILEQVLIDRLRSPGAEPPFPYLTGCYRRASEEEKKIRSVKDQKLRSELESVARQAKKLAVSYCRLHLANPDIFSDSSGKPSSSPLLPLILGETLSSPPAPPGFLDEFFRDADYVSLEPIFNGLYEDLRRGVLKVSALGNFQDPLTALVRLATSPHGAKALVNHPRWIPKGDFVNGRVIETTSILGAFFHVSALPDRTIFMSEPDVGEKYFSLRGGDLVRHFADIKNVMKILHDGLGQVLLSLLRNSSDTRESVLEYLAEVIKKNSSRSRLQVDPLSCASSGTFVNLSAVMLRLCEPFLDANLTKRNKIDPSYVFSHTRLEFRDLTALHASSEDVTAWANKENPANYTFICECFFMTARVLNLGLVKAISDLKCIDEDLSRSEAALSRLKSMRLPETKLEIERLEKEIELYSQDKFCYEAQLVREPTLLRRALDFYRLMVVWLVELAGGFQFQFQTPLPSSCPMRFASIPEHFIEDAMEVLIFASRVPGALEGVLLDDFMNFIITFMASPAYIRNPYLRAKMVEALKCWIPKRTGLFEANRLALDRLVRNLLMLYVDVEFTGSHTQFYDKFNIRHNIAKLLEYLWKVPSHRNAWKHVAKEEEKGVYLNFLNFLINDSIYLLDESFSKIHELKGMEGEMSNSTSAERERQLESHERIIGIDMKLAMEDVGMLAFTTEQITAPLLLPEMVERVANMLNYFLSQLAGPNRRSLSLKEPEKYGFRPKELLRKIVSVYVHLAKGDREGIFPGAVSGDGRSYSDRVFTTTAELLRAIGEDGGVIDDFVALGAKARDARSEAMDVEAALGEIPDEFLDPIQYTLMRDPVILPSSRMSVDRPVIERHLLSDRSDPFNRSHLTQDMLIPDVGLKARIDEFVRSHYCRGLEGKGRI